MLNGSGPGDKQLVDRDILDGKGKDLRGRLAGFLGGFRYSNSTGFTSPPGKDLCLYHDLAAERCCGGNGGCLRVGDQASVRRDAVLGEEFLGLVFVDLNPMSPCAS